MRRPPSGLIMRLLLTFAAALFLATPAMAARDFRIGAERFSEGDILDARALPSMDGIPLVMITLTDDAARRFHKLTEAMVGRPMPIQLDGKELMAPLVREPISGGVLEISGLPSWQECQRLARIISGKDPVPDSLED